MQTAVRYALTGVLIGAVTVELVGAEAHTPAEVGRHEHVPEPEREPVSSFMPAPVTVSTTAATDTNFAAGILWISNAQYWDTVRFDHNPVGLLIAVGFVTNNNIGDCEA